jgi:hypothetical protein
MEPITIVTSYVAMKMVDQFISQEGYGFFKKLFFSKKKYAHKLYQIIEESAFEFEVSYPLADGKVPFYHSQPLFETLNNYVLFNKMPEQKDLLNKFKEYPDVTPPSQNELEIFYQIFTAKIKNCNELKRLHIDETYKDKIFEIGDSLFEIKLLIESLVKELTFTLNQDWLDNRCREAVADLDGRYTPELNLQLDIAKIFEGIGRTKNFADEMFSRFDSLLIRGNKISRCDEVSTQLSIISKNIEAITKLYQDSEFCGVGEIPINKFNDWLAQCQEAVLSSESVLWDLREELKESKETKMFEDKYSCLLRELRAFDDDCNKLTNYLASTTVKLASNPYLLLDGEAGIGKSHLLADLIETRIETGYSSIFILGQQLTSDESPWNQIFNRFQLKVTSDEFLEKLNLYGQHTGKKVLIVIDAINEGSGNTFWSNYINSFVDEIRSYSWLGLVMSVRTTYQNITITEEQILRNDFEVHRHLGFKNVGLDAVNLFYDNYNIERPSSPLLNPEFTNPLFLKLFCEGIRKSGLNKIPKGFQGITTILDFFVDGVNKTLSSHKKYNFDPSFSLVKDALTELVKLKLKTGKHYIPLRDAFTAVNSVVKDYVDNKNFLSDMINEGVLMKGLALEGGDNVDVVYISFERFDDHLTVKYLLEDVKDIETEFKTGGKFKEYFKDEHSLYVHQGLIEALSIQLPEKYDKEFYELLSDFENNNRVILANINSLIWRKADSINLDKLIPFINNNVLRYQNTSSHFLETIISLSPLEAHPFNAYFLHRNLMSLNLPERDEFWTTELRYKYSEESTFRHLIDWAWSDNDNSYISDESIELAAITLCWFLTSSNRELRDCSTKGLVCLLQNRISVLINIIKKFGGVDDPFVTERVYAVALGCTLRTKQKEKLKELAELVYETVFNQAAVYPHVLLRDYARELIEYANHLELNLERVNIEKTIPPYMSSWPEVIPTKDELEKLYDRTDYCHLWSSIMSGGDFSRYTIGTNHNHSEWSGCKFGDTPINRQELFKDFKKALDEEQLNLFSLLDPIIYDEEAEDFVVVETVIRMGIAIGKKTEEEILTNKSIFKDSLSSELLASYESEVEPYIDHNNNLLDTDTHFDLRLAERFIFNRVIQLGWEPDKHGEFDKSIGSGRGRYESHQERIGKKYQWIAYYEFMARLSDNFIRYDGYRENRVVNPYIGPWSPYVRDIDPTILLRTTGNQYESKQVNWWDDKESFLWDCTFDEWVKDKSTLNNPQALIEVIDEDAEKWLVLESYPEWRESKVIGNEDWGCPRKEVWCHVRSYLVSSSEYQTFKKWVGTQHFMGGWMPESVDRYQLFNREYYWSIAFESFKNDYYSGSDWVDVNDKNKFIAKVSPTATSYYWEEEFDRSKRDTLRFLKPSSLIFDKMVLKHGDKEGSFIDKNGDVICFAAEALNDCKPHLLVKKEPFLKMLKENDLEVVWTLLGEKGVIGGSLSSNHNYGRVEFSGAFYIEGDNVEVKGSHKAFKTC